MCPELKKPKVERKKKEKKKKALVAKRLIHREDNDFTVEVINCGHIPYDIGTILTEMTRSRNILGFVTG